MTKTMKFQPGLLILKCWKSSTLARPTWSCVQKVFREQKVVVGCGEGIQAAITTLVQEVGAASRLFFIRATLVLQFGCSFSHCPQIIWIEFDCGTFSFLPILHERRAMYERIKRFLLHLGIISCIVLCFKGSSQLLRWAWINIPWYPVDWCTVHCGPWPPTLLKKVLIVAENERVGGRVCRRGWNSGIHPQTLSGVWGCRERYIIWLPL